jgi:hypothetical protein
LKLSRAIQENAKRDKEQELWYRSCQIDALQVVRDRRGEGYEKSAQLPRKIPGQLERMAGGDQQIPYIDPYNDHAFEVLHVGSLLLIPGFTA